MGLVALRISVACACGCAIWFSYELASADFLFKQDTEPSIRAAIRLVPDGWNTICALPSSIRRMRETTWKPHCGSTHSMPGDIELGLRFESEGDYVRAEKQFLEAYNIDTRTCSLEPCQLLFPSRQHSSILALGRSAAYMPSDDIGSLLSFAGAFLLIQRL